ncbi:hypothetical protein SCHPADRAFT_939840 [Schizopora paradoxa]|uniref:Uncharacterized protein n=1 Tax=Schizopora paradoxa TaxID=27342 RepID=A0A0H2RX93_9AGAM|nr:hypothetical protein SCHPADRAFT_939840 [Schizopora paradoxa]
MFWHKFAPEVVPEVVPEARVAESFIQHLVVTLRCPNLKFKLQLATAIGSANRTQPALALSQTGSRHEADGTDDSSELSSLDETLPLALTPPRIVRSNALESPNTQAGTLPVQNAISERDWRFFTSVTTGVFEELGEGTPPASLDVQAASNNSNGTIQTEVENTIVSVADEGNPVRVRSTRILMVGGRPRRCFVNSDFSHAIPPTITATGSESLDTGASASLPGRLESLDMQQSNETPSPVYDACVWLGLALPPACFISRMIRPVPVTQNAGRESVSTVFQALLSDTMKDSVRSLLSGLIHQEGLYLSSSRVPIHPRGHFDSTEYGFETLCPIRDVLQSPLQVQECDEGFPETIQLRQLYAIPQDQPIFVFYIGLNTTLQLPTQDAAIPVPATTPGATPTNVIVEAPGQAIAEETNTSSTQDELSEDVQSYLDEKFPEEFSDLTNLRAHTTFYGSAYSAIQRVRLAKSVLTSLKLTNATKVHDGTLQESDGQTVTVSVKMEDVAKWLGWTLHLYRNNKTFTKTAFEVWKKLTKVNLTEKDLLSDDDVTLMNQLDVMFKEGCRFIPPDGEDSLMLSVSQRLILEKSKKKLAKLLHDTEMVHGKATLHDVPDNQKPF